MKIVVDNKIPFIKGEIEKLGSTIVYLSAHNITAEQVKDADVLVIRTRTICNKNLLDKSSVKFIATATIGYDHIDVDYCKDNGIEWRNAPGCNANSVRQYILSTLLLIENKYKERLSSLTIGVVGVGHVGSRIAELADELGMRVLLCDPIRANKEESFSHQDLAVLAEQADIITFHTPLTFEGIEPTYHLADSSFFNKLKKNAILINTSRGEVVDGNLLKEALSKSLIRDAVIDVWENEPNIDKELLDKVWISTPHIAGYSADGKAKATEMALQAICSYFEISGNISITPPDLENSTIVASTMAEAILKIYNPLDDSKSLKECSSSFEELRGNYHYRREQLAFTINIVD